MKKLIPILIIVAILLVGYYAINKIDKNKKVGSIIESQELKATSTPFLAGWTDQLIKKGSGALGSVIITKAGDNAFLLLDATTTANAIDDFATTTKTLAQFPADTVAGTYVFDVVYNDGLVIEIQSGTLGSSTITFR